MNIKELNREAKRLKVAAEKHGDKGAGMRKKSGKLKRSFKAFDSECQ